jgi:hypothetical protein
MRFEPISLSICECRGNESGCRQGIGRRAISSRPIGDGAQVLARATASFVRSIDPTLERCIHWRGQSHNQRSTLDAQRRPKERRLPKSFARNDLDKAEQTQSKSAAHNGLFAGWSPGERSTISIADHLHSGERLRPRLQKLVAAIAPE